MLIKDELVGRVVRVKYYRTQGYPAGSLARVLWWASEREGHSGVVYACEFSDRTVVFLPREEITLTQRGTRSEEELSSSLSRN